MQRWQQKKNSENLLEKFKARQFIDLVAEAKLITEFDLDLYFKLVEKMTVFDEEKIIISLLDGTEIECQME